MEKAAATRKYPLADMTVRELTIATRNIAEFYREVSLTDDEPKCRVWAARLATLYGRETAKIIAGRESAIMRSWRYHLDQIQATGVRLPKTKAVIHRPLEGQSFKHVPEEKPRRRNFTPPTLH